MSNFGLNGFWNLALDAPTITYIGQAGTMLDMRWNPVVGAKRYEVWAVPTVIANMPYPPTGGILIANTQATFVSQVLNFGQVSNVALQNPGFETGNLYNWIQSNYASSAAPWGITSSDKYAGVYSASIVFSQNGSGNGWTRLTNGMVPCVPGQSYVFSMAHKITALYKAAFQFGRSSTILMGSVGTKAHLTRFMWQLARTPDGLFRPVRRFHLLAVK